MCSVHPCQATDALPHPEIRLALFRMQRPVMWWTDELLTAADTMHSANSSSYSANNAPLLMSNNLCAGWQGGSL